MSIETNRKTAEKFYDCIAKQDFAGLKALCTDDFAYFPRVQDEHDNLEDFIRIERDNMIDYGDYTMKLVDTIAEGNRVACYLTFEGTLQKDTYHGLPAKKGSHAFMDFMTILTFRDGKICEKRAKYNMLDVLRMSGVKHLDL